MMQVKMGMTIDQLCRESWLDREDCIVIAYFIIVSYLGINPTTVGEDFVCPCG